MPTITEESATITAELPEAVSKDMAVFYNPVMQTNRDLTIGLLEALGRTEMRLCDPLAGSGIRAIRLLKELPAGTVKELVVNDLKKTLPTTFQENARLSHLTVPEGVSIHTTEASRLLLSSRAFDYIDIDPFGSPNPFLDAAVKRLRKGGILAVTATDTAPLCGTYPKACKRKYWATPRRDHLMHEYGLRILVHKCQLVGAQYDQALLPIFSYSLDHYFRVFFEAQPGKKKADEILARHKTIDGYGPLWTGPLWDTDLVRKIIERNRFPNHGKLLKTLLEEAAVGNVGFYDVHELARELQLAGPPRHDELLAKIRDAGFTAARTHFSPIGIKSNIDKKQLLALLTE